MHPIPGDDVIEQRVENLAAGATRRLVIRALLRASLTATVLVVLYFTLPLTGSLDASAALRLVVGLLAFAGVVTWQIRAVLRSHHPGLRAIEALAAAIPLFLLVFAAAYLPMADADAGAFSEPLSRTDALYFTITVFSTVGFGDITQRPTWPASPPWSRCWATSWSWGWCCTSWWARSKPACNAGQPPRRASPIHPRRVMPEKGDAGPATKP